MAFSSLAEHLGEVGEEADGLPVSTSVDHGPDQRPNIVFGNIVHRCPTKCWQKVLVKAPLQLGISIFTRDAIQQPGLGQILDGQYLHLRRLFLLGFCVRRGMSLCLGGFLLLVGIDLLINERSGLVAGLADVGQGFARPGPAGVLFVLVAPPIAIEKADRYAVLAGSRSVAMSSRTWKAA